MSQVHISLNLEIFEILNAFPILTQVFDSLYISLDKITEGINLEEFLLTKKLNDSEVDRVLRKLNLEVDLFLRGKSSFDKVSFKEKEEALGIEMIQ